jgi:hypothetical protein
MWLPQKSERWKQNKNNSNKYLLNTDYIPGTVKHFV